MLLALFVFPLVFATAQPRERMREMIHRRSETRQSLIDKLNLSDEQQLKMKKLRLDFEKKQIESRSKIQTARVGMKELWIAEKLDRSSIEKQLKNISDLQHQSRLNRLDHMLAINAILTPEQQKIWKDHMAMGKMEMRRGRHDMWRGGAMDRFDMEDD